MRLRSTLVALLLTAAPVLADGAFQNIVTPADKARLDNYPQTRAQALDEARKGGSATDVATLDEVVNKAPVSFDGFDMNGEWRCRTIKAGGMATLVVYDWFKCQVSDDGSGWFLEKTSGSQRTEGRFYTESDTRLHYLGSMFIAGDTPKPYASGPETDQAGFAFLASDGSWRIELPEPYYESKLDILEFRR